MRRVKVKSERIYLRAPDMNVGMKVDIDGEVSAEQLYRAVEKVSIIHPLLKASIDVEENGKAYYVLDSVDAITPRYIDVTDNETKKNDLKKNNNKKKDSKQQNFIVKAGGINIEYADDDKGEWQEVFKKYDNLVFDLVNGPLIRIILIRRSGACTIIIVGHHIIGDAYGFVSLVKDIMTMLAYSDMEILEKNPFLPKGINVLPSKSQLGFVNKFLVNNINKQWQKEKRVFSDSEYRNMFNDYRMTYNSSFKMLHLDSYATLKLKNRCREHNITFNSVIISAFLYALQHNIPGHYHNKERIEFGLNARKKLSVDMRDTLANYSSLISIQKEYDDTVDMWTNAADIRKKINKRKSSVKNRYLLLQFMSKIDGNVLDATHFDTFGDYSSKTAKKVADMLGISNDYRGLGISNIAECSIPTDYGRYRINDIAYICPNQSGNDISLGIIYFNGQINISVRYSGKNINEKQINQICHDALDKLYN